MCLIWSYVYQTVTYDALITVIVGQDDGIPAVLKYPLVTALEQIYSRSQETEACVSEKVSCTSILAPLVLLLNTVLAMFIYNSFRVRLIVHIEMNYR